MGSEGGPTKDLGAEGLALREINSKADPLAP